MSDIKKYFISRFPEGYIVEADFSQLEVVVLAHLSQDPRLIADLLSGEDLHAIRAAELFGVSISQFMYELQAGNSHRESQRKIAKALSFQLQYGSGAPNMAKKNKIPVSIARNFINNYYQRYPKVKDFQGKVALEVANSREILNGEVTDKGLPRGTGYYRSETGRIYTFKEYDDWNGDVSFSPTQMKNYPVQGTATGDIVPMVLGKVFRALKNDPVLSDTFLLVNTVHDSILFDVKDEKTLARGVPFVKMLMEKAPEYYEELTGIKFSLPLKVEFKVGKNWLEVSKYESN